MIASENRGLTFVYLGYMDDSGTTNENNRMGVYAAVLIPADDFLSIEQLHRLCVLEVLPEDRRANFKEFHARDLFRGKKQFEGIPDPERFKVIEVLLKAIVNYSDIVVVYGAVNKVKLASSNFASAQPYDIAFRECLDAIELWLIKKTNEAPQDQNSESCLLIVDEVATEDPKTQPIKTALKDAFRSKRKRQWKDGPDSLRHIHDDLYFGDSDYSVGIQIADLCAYFISLKLLKDKDGDPFYEIFAERVKVERLKP